MKRFLFVSAALLVAMFGAAAGPVTAQFGDHFGAGVAIAGGEVAVIQPSLGVGRAAVYLFGWTGSAWERTGALHPVGHDRTGEGFSPSVAQTPEGLVVGAADPGGSWAAHLFRRDGREWDATRIPRMTNPGERESGPMTLATLSAVSGPPGRVIAASPEGDLLAVSLAGSGEVTVVRRTDEHWEVEDGPGPGGERGARSFGAGLAIDAFGTLWVGVPEYGESGAVFGYTPTARGWIPSDTVTGEALGPGARLGAVLLASGERLFVGAPRADAVLRVVAGYQSYIRAPSGLEGDFGAALASDGEELWVGAPEADGGRGVVVRYRWPDGATAEVLGELSPVGGRQDDGFGRALALAGGLGVVGAPGAHAGRGRAAVFRRSADGWSFSSWLTTGIVLPEVRGDDVACREGHAAGFDCEQVDLMAFLPLEALGAAEDESVTDLWGWTDPETGREYALVGRSTGVAIVDVTEPTDPVYMGRVSGNRTHARDIKVYADHMFFTGDGAGRHGLLIFDLTRLRSVMETAAGWEPDARYDGIASAHNLVIDTETGFGYTVGNRAGGTTCGGGLHMVDLRNPLSPTFAGCYTDTEGLIWQGRTHDAQCVIYRGPDEDYRGREICFALNETAVRIVDVTDKKSPVPIAAGRYPGMAYVHQGWLTEDHRYFYQNDEADELAGVTDRTRTLIWNVEDLDDPVLVGEHRGPNNATDHNLYVVGDRMYQANYFAGLRVLDISDRENPVEVGHFDTTPYGGDPPGFSGGAWTAYPFFESGTVIVSSMNEGLFVLRPARPIIP